MEGFFMEITDIKDQKLYDLIVNELNELTYGAKWYEDTPKTIQILVSTGNKWLINPKSKTWYIEVRFDLDVFFNIGEFSIFDLIPKDKLHFRNQVIRKWIYDNIGIVTKRIYEWQGSQLAVDIMINYGKEMKPNSLNESSNREEKLRSAVNDYFEETYLKNSQWLLIDNDEIGGIDLYFIDILKEEWIFEARQSGVLFFNEEIFLDIKKLFNFRDNEIIESLIENVMKKFPNIEYSSISPIWVDNEREIRKALEQNKKINNQRWVRGRGLKSDDQSPQT